MSSQSLTLTNEGPLVDITLPYVFEPLSIPSRYKAIHGGRGSAKSWSVAKQLIIDSMDHYERVLCAREYQTTIKDSVKEVLDTQIRMMGVEDLFHSTNTEIINKENGSNFIFYGLRRDPHKIKSLEGVTKCWIEEANTVSQQNLDDLDPTIRVDDSEIWFTFNCKFKTDPVYKMFITEGRDDAVVIKANYHDNPFFPKVLQKQMLFDKQHDDGKYRHIWLGEPQINSEILVFNGKWRRDDDIAPGEDTILYYGADWGFANDPTCLVRMWLDDDKREIYIDYEAYGVGVEIDDTPQLFESVPGAKKWKITADSARPETISYIKRKGFNIKAAKKGKDSVIEGVEFLKNYTLVVHPRCKHVIDELGLYSYKTDKLTGEILPILEDKNNHTIDAIRYALEQVAFSKRSRIHIG